MKIMVMPFHHKAFTLIVLYYVVILAHANYGCEVGVTLPWQRKTYIPQNAYVVMSCVDDSSEQDLAWSIVLAGSGTYSQFQYNHSISLLNNRGFFKLPDITTERIKTIRLAIDSLEGNNGTRILCTHLGSATTVSETTIVVFEPTSVDLNATITDVALRSISISWNPFQSVVQNTTQVYTLTVTSMKFPTAWSVLEMQVHYEFTAPEDAPPCEVYNISVAATFVGATYTGANCFVGASHINNRMLPSLPTIDRLNISLIHTLEKLPTGVSLLVSFQPANYCKWYPVINYIVEVRGKSQMQSVMSAENSVTVNNLTEDEICTYRILAMNEFGSIPSKEITFYTSDVQNVTINVLRDVRGIKLQCDFITGSNARGCLVIVRLGEFNNITVNLTKEEKDTSTIKEVKISEDFRSCDIRGDFSASMLAYDIESDGAVGTLAIAGHVEKSDLEDLCNGSQSLINKGIWFAVMAVFSILIL